jgi:hypothetical protein
MNNLRSLTTNHTNPANLLLALFPLFVLVSEVRGKNKNKFKGVFYEKHT